MKTQGIIIKRVELCCPHCSHIFDAFDSPHVEPDGGIDQGGAVACTGCEEFFEYEVTT